MKKPDESLGDLIVNYILKNQPVTEKELCTYLRNKKIRDTRQKKNLKTWKTIHFESDEGTGWWSRTIQDNLDSLQAFNIIGEYDGEAREIAKACFDLIKNKINKNGFIVLRPGRFRKEVFKEKK